MMPRVGRTLQQIAEADNTRMGYLLQEMHACFDPDSLDSYTYIDKLCFLSEIVDKISACAKDEHDRIVAKLNPVNTNVWLDENCMYGKSGTGTWWETPHMDCAMDDEAYAAKDALTHIQAVQRVYCDGPEVYAAVRQTAAIGHHDTLYFTDMPPATLHDLANRAWYDVGCGRGLNRLIVERHIFTTLMNDLRGEEEEAFTNILLDSTNEDMEGFITLLRNKFR